MLSAHATEHLSDASALAVRLGPLYQTTRTNRDSPFCQNLLPGAHTSDKVCVILPAECWLAGLVLNSMTVDTWKVIDQVLITLSQLDDIVTAELPPASAVTEYSTGRLPIDCGARTPFTHTRTPGGHFRTLNQTTVHVSGLWEETGAKRKPTPASGEH